MDMSQSHATWRKFQTQKCGSTYAEHKFVCAANIFMIYRLTV